MKPLRILIYLGVHAISIDGSVCLSPMFKGSNSSISKSIKRYLYKFNLCNDVFTYYSSAHFRRSMERSHAVDICEDLVTTVHHIWEILDEKDTPRVFSRTEVDILLDHLCT